LQRAPGRRARQALKVLAVGACLLVAWAGRPPTARAQAEEADADDGNAETHANAAAVAAKRREASSELLDVLGHELRNPLNAISSATEVLRLLGGGGQKASIARDYLYHQTRQLAQSLDELLSAGRVLLGHGKLLLYPLDLTAQVSSFLARRMGNADQPSFEHDVCNVWVAADAVNLDLALNRLFLAAAHCAPHSSIGVAVHAQGNRAQLTITLSQGGSGDTCVPGLALARQLIELHGGMLRVEDDNGRQYWCVDLPRIEAPTSAQPAAAARLCTVLLIDDDASALCSLSASLVGDGYRIASSAGGEEGLGTLLEQLPDVAVIDIEVLLPRGLDVARRSRGAGYAGRLIALTSDGDEAVRLALHAGFDASIAKPYDVAQLRRLLRAD
jgi:CheY-like chemotaxis protein